MFLRRLDTPPSAPNRLCSVVNCPAVLEMEMGDFAIVGMDITDVAAGSLLPGTGCGPGERIVQIPRATLIAARAEIPTTLQ